jgi:hypothetical protein
VTPAWNVGCVLLTLASLAGPNEVRAQVPGRVEVAVGGSWAGPIRLGSEAARLTTAEGGSRVLFETRSDLTARPGIEAAVHFRVVRFLRIGATVLSSRARLETRISADAEGAPETTVSERVTEFAIGGAILADLRPSAGGRARPFISAGAAHLRHLHEGRPLVETGETYHVGGGLDYLLRQRGRAVGMRADVRAVLRSRGLLFDAAIHVSPAAVGSLFVRF